MHTYLGRWASTHSRLDLVVTSAIGIVAIIVIIVATAIFMHMFFTRRRFLKHHSKALVDMLIWSSTNEHVRECVVVWTGSRRV